MKLYKSKYDLRDMDFSCKDDSMKGELYFVDKIMDVSKNRSADFKNA